MVLLRWVWDTPRGTSEPQRHESERDFNYDSECSTAAALTEERLQAMQRGGFAINHSRVKIGQGVADYHRAKRLLRDWRHFELDWAFVQPAAPAIRPGQAFSVCSREPLVWIVNPLRVRFIHDDHQEGDKTVFAFGSGTLRGHLLAGEERFAVEWNKADDSVWYEIFSFSKPAHPLSLATYPYVRFKQRQFAHQSSRKMVEQMLSQS